MGCQCHGPRESVSCRMGKGGDEWGGGEPLICASCPSSIPKIARRIVLDAPRRCAEDFTLGGDSCHDGKVLAVGRHQARRRGPSEGEEHFCTHGGSETTHGSGPYHDLRQRPRCRMRKGVEAARALGHTGAPGVQEGQGGGGWMACHLSTGVMIPTAEKRRNCCSRFLTADKGWNFCSRFLVGASSRNRLTMAELTRMAIQK